MLRAVSLPLHLKPKLTNFVDSNVTHVLHDICFDLIWIKNNKTYTFIKTTLRQGNSSVQIILCFQEKIVTV